MRSYVPGVASMLVAYSAYDMYLKPSISCLCRKGHLDPDGHRNRTGRGDHNVRVCLVEIRFGFIVIWQTVA